MSTTRRIISALALVTLVVSCASTNKHPEVTHDGLVRDHSYSHAEVYKKPGATLAEYDEYGLVPCRVTFRKNWVRDQNQSRIDLGNRVTQKDVDRIKDALSAECDKYFRSALEEAPPYKLVDQFMEGEKVLILAPSIVNLDIAAPDMMSAGRGRTYTTSSGQMTLFLEVVDGTTHDVLFRVVDRKRAPEYGTLRWSNSVTNKADADRALKYWAGKLRTALDTAHQAP